MIQITKISHDLLESLESVFEYVRNNTERHGDISTVYTFNALQSDNLMNTKYASLLKELLQETSLNNMYELFHAHSIEYKVGGYQEEHNHPQDDLSFILYFDTEKTGSTILKLNDEIVSVDQVRGTLLIFHGHIPHSGTTVETNKRIIVGALKIR